MCIILQYLSGFAIRSIKYICVCPGGAVTCSPYSVTVFSFARFLPSFFNKLGCTAKITSICCERLQMQMFIYCGGLQMLMHIYSGELQMLMCFYCGELQILMHIYCGGLQMLIHITVADCKFRTETSPWILLHQALPLCHSFSKSDSPHGDISCRLQ